jgi:hypothetical protein
MHEPNQYVCLDPASDIQQTTFSLFLLVHPPLFQFSKDYYTNLYTGIDSCKCVRTTAVTQTLVFCELLCLVNMIEHDRTLHVLCLPACLVDSYNRNAIYVHVAQIYSSKTQPPVETTQKQPLKQLH